MCGVRILTPEGYSAVDAAHIVPWSVTRDDQIGNGMALCKLCHWAFDGGLMGVAEDYTVLLSRQINAHPNTAGLLTTLAGRNLIVPSDPALQPLRENLAAHRRRHALLDGKGCGGST